MRLAFDSRGNKDPRGIGRYIRSLLAALRETGRLVAPGDPDALGAAVLEVLSRRDELGAAGPGSVRRFHTGAYADRVEALLAP